MYKQLEVGTSSSHLSCYGFGTNTIELLALGPKSTGKNSRIKKNNSFILGRFIYSFSAMAVPDSFLSLSLQSLPLSLNF